MMDYQVLLNTIQETNRCQLAQIEQAAAELTNDDNVEGSEKNTALCLLSTALLSCENLIGTADNYHNVAVAYAREDAEDIACHILEKGLERFPQSVDLLADYLKYIISCADFSSAYPKQSKLASIPRTRWNWRAFAFSIDFLFARLERENIDQESNAVIKQEIGELIEEYQKYHPFDEQAFLAQAEMHQYFNEHEKESETLESAIGHLKSAPKCLLRYADMQFEKGEYSKALELINRCKRDAVEPQLGVNYGYTYYLSALCKIALFFDSNSDSGESSSEKKTQIEDIYNDCKVALKILRNLSYKNNIEMLVKVIEIKTGIDYLDD